MSKKQNYSSTAFHAMFINCQYQSEVVFDEEDGFIILNDITCEFNDIRDSFITIKLVIEESEDEEARTVYHTYFFTSKELLNFFKDIYYYNHTFSFTEARKIVDKNESF